MKVTGSLQIKNGIYQAVLSYYDENKQKWMQKWKTTKITSQKGNKKIAEKALNEIVRNYENGLEQKEKGKKEHIRSYAIRIDNKQEDNFTLRAQRINENKEKSFIQFAKESLEEFKNHIVITIWTSNFR